MISFVTDNLKVFMAYNKKLFFSKVYKSVVGFPRGAEVKASASNVGKPGFDPWAGKIPWEKEMATHSSILA